MKEQFRIEGMSCAACSTRVQKTIEEVAGTQDVAVNLLTGNATVEVEDKKVVEDIIQAVDKAGYKAIVASAGGGSDRKSSASDAAHASEIESRKRLIISILFAVPLFYLSMGRKLSWPVPQVFTDSVQGLMALGLTELLLVIPIMFVDRHFFIGGIKAFKQKNPNMDSLIALSAGSSFLYGLKVMYSMIFATQTFDVVEGYANLLSFESAGMILALISLGKYLEAKAKGHTTDAIEDLIDMAPKTATLLVDGHQKEVECDTLKVGDVVLVKAGSAIPVDGVVVRGSGSVDVSAITGEPMPDSIKEDSNVVAATSLLSGLVEVRATAVGSDTQFAHIIKLVDEATSTKAPVERVADRIAGIFVPSVMLISLVTFVGWMIAGASFNEAFNRCVSVLVISCPCALGLATPTAVMVGTGQGAKHGLLVKSAATLEAVCATDVVVLDKTGTLTEGKPSVIKAISTSENDVVDFLYTANFLEANSSHPLALAILDYAKDKGISQDGVVEDFEIIDGMGIVGKIGKDFSFIGNRQLAEENGANTNLIELDEEDLANTILYVGKTDKLLGVFVVDDSIKESSSKAVSCLSELGVKTLMLTGDNDRAASRVAQTVGVDDYVAQVLPSEKERYVRDLQDKGLKVAMVGDGINDAPALARADVGIAIGAGVDIAIESADIVLMKSDPVDIVRVIELSQATLKNIKQNMVWALLYNVVCIPAAAGVISFAHLIMNPTVGALAMSFSSLFVVTNALRLSTWNSKLCPFEDKDKKQETIVLDSKEKNMKKLKMNVEGMMCQMCVKHVREALENLDGAANVKVDLDNKAASVELAEDKDPQVALDAINECGYKASLK